MGCASSKVEHEEIVAICKARRRYMRLAVSSRHHFAAAHGCYLQALRNTGAALRQFAEGESVEISPRQSHHPPHHRCLNLPLPPPPPPPPEMSPYQARSGAPPNDPVYAENAGGGGSPQLRPKEEFWTTSQHSNAPPSPPPPPPAPASAWDFWDVFGPPLHEHQQAAPTREEEQRRRGEWEEEQRRRGEWEEEQRRRGEWEEEQHQWRPRPQEWADNATATTSSAAAATDVDDVVENRVENKSPEPQTDDNSSMVSWHTKDTDLAVIVSANPSDLAQIVRDLDDYFLKASTGGKDVSMLLETGGAHFQHALGQPTKNSYYHSAKVFNALSWTWTSRSQRVITRDCIDFNNNYESGPHGSHCSTLERLYAWEKKLYEEVRCGESTKIEHDKKLALLRKQEAKGEEEMKVDKTKAAIKRLESQIMVAFQAVDTTSAAIVKLRENELYPQLVDLSKGLMDMWRTMYECHQVQSLIVQQVRHLDNLATSEATSVYHQRATIQLESEVTAWYNSFCSLIKSQREYMRALNGWLRLCLLQPANEMEGKLENHPPLYALCEEWQLALDRLPDQSASGGIKSFVTVIHAIVVQQAEEQKQRKKSESLSRELEKKLASLRNMEKKYYDPYATPERREVMSELDPKDPLTQKKARTEALKRRVEEEKSNHLKSIRVTRAMTLNNLQTGLPNVFQAMTGFSSVCMQAFESIYDQTKSFNNHSCIRRLN